MLTIPQLKAKIAIRALTLHAAALARLEKAKPPPGPPKNDEEDGGFLGENPTKERYQLLNGKSIPPCNSCYQGDLLFCKVNSLILDVRRYSASTLAQARLRLLVVQIWTTLIERALVALKDCAQERKGGKDPY
jgi:hypothetical protein